MPYTAKDKKSALFNNDYSQSEYVINKIYHDIFNWDEANPSNNGLIFSKKKAEIDEALFVQQLYRETKRLMKAKLTERITKAKEQRDNAKTAAETKAIDERIATNELHSETVGICMFYFITLYYEFKAQFARDEKTYLFNEYYSNKVFKQSMIEDATNLFLTYTVKILVKTATNKGKTANMNNWVRSSACEVYFLEVLRNEIASDLDVEEKYNDFCAKYMA